MAYEQLGSKGDASLGEWTDDRQEAFHLRRRLSAAEQELIGPAIDLRGTEEALKRFDSVVRVLPPEAVYLAEEELNGTL